MAKIVIEVPDHVLAGKSNQDVRRVIGEALYEYADRRDPAEAYVARRYPTMPEPNTPEYSWLDREKKVADVYRRVELSYLLRDHLSTLNIEPSEEPS